MKICFICIYIKAIFTIIAVCRYIMKIAEGEIGTISSGFKNESIRSDAKLASFQ